MDKLVIIAVALIAVVGAAVLIGPQLMQQPAEQSYENQPYQQAQDTELTSSVDSEWSNDSDYVEIGEII